jgi:hypothetical protein
VRGGLILALFLSGVTVYYLQPMLVIFHRLDPESMEQIAPAIVETCGAIGDLSPERPISGNRGEGRLKCRSAEADVTGRVAMSQWDSPMHFH